MTHPDDTTEQARRVCGERAYLYPQLVPAALAFAPGSTAIPQDVERHVRCTLQEHSTGDHHALVMDLDGTDTGSVWTHWTQGRFPSALVVLPDCDATGPAPGYEACCEYADHPGAHTWQLHDPWRTFAAPLQPSPAQQAENPAVRPGG